jgi:hypothetical protein
MSAMDYAELARAPHQAQKGRRTAPVVMALAALVFGRNERRKERLAVLREREMELEIARLRAVGGC